VQASQVLVVPATWLKALRGNPDGLVTVLLVAVSASTVAAGAAVWEAILLLTCGLGFYHIRVSAAERHRERMAFLKIDDAMFKLSVTKSKYNEDLEATDAQFRRILGRPRR